MATCLEAKELNEMKARSERMAKFVSALVSLPFHYFSFVLTSYRLFIKMYLYFLTIIILQKLKPACVTATTKNLSKLRGPGCLWELIIRSSGLTL